MAKAKRSKAQKEASMRNLKKARSATRRKKGGTKTSRKAGYIGTKVKPRSPAQKKAALKNIKKAQARSRALARGRRGGTTSHRAPARPTSKKASKQTPKQRAASLRNLKKARAVQKRGGKRRGLTPRQRAYNLRRARKTSRKLSRKKKTLSRKHGHDVRGYSYTRKAKRVGVPGHMSLESQTRKQRAASLRNLKKAHAARRRGGHHRGYEYAMENPLGGVEVFVGLVTGLAGFMTADIVDRVLATHALTDKSAKDTSGHELFADNPLTAATWKGNYANLFNPTAIAAPMSLARWGFGLGITIVPVVIAKWVEQPVGRSALQMFGFGSGMRVLGKGLIDLLAMITKWTQFGQRFYDGELRAAALAAGDGTETSLPSAGLGATPPGMGCACQNCQSGVGSCCSQEAGAAGTGSAPGTGYPGMPREVSREGAPPPPPPPTAALPAPPPPPPPTAALPAAPPSYAAPPYAAPLQGTPETAFAKRNPFAWGQEAA